MYKIAYTLQFESDEGFVIASYDANIHSADATTAPAIKMEIFKCASDTAIVNFHEAAQPEYGLKNFPKDFWEHFDEVLDGQYEDWRLVMLRIQEPGSLLLTYQKQSSDDSEDIRLDINHSRINELTLSLEVPHADGRPAAKYVLMLDSRKDTKAHTIGSSTLIEAHYPHLGQRRIFMLDSSKSDQLSVTDVYDL